MTVQTLELGGKKFVVVEQDAFQKLLRAAEKNHRMSRQDSEDVEESKRRLAEQGSSIPWKQIKTERASGRTKRVA